VTTPAGMIVGYGVDMTGKHQAVRGGPVGTAADAGDQVDLVVACGQRLELAVETNGFEAIGQCFGGATITTIKCRIGAADGVCGDQFCERVAPVELRSHRNVLSA